MLRELGKPLMLNVAESLLSRIKIMCELDITERRMPQDGHFRVILEGQEIDFRVVTTPTIAGSMWARGCLKPASFRWAKW